MLWQGSAPVSAGPPVCSLGQASSVEMLRMMPSRRRWGDCYRAQLATSRSQGRPRVSSSDRTAPGGSKACLD